jgi:hypothetical protein
MAEKYIASKNLDLKFEIKENKQWYPEIGEVEKMIKQCEEQYFKLKKLNKKKEAEQMMYNIIEAKYSKHHLHCVMNLDFSRPTKKMRQQAEESKIDIGDPDIVNQFKRIQE